ncbi:hypothetical protein L7F22_032852 [Adiantum nelumboides]|nr:hypothetical protein [Adiantum nelumboides]
MARFGLDDFKKQASFFLREKLNDARLALTDVSRMQLLTEEATNEDPWGPETRTMAILADAAFELEEYERIVQVIHHRLEGGKKGPWRQLYKTLVVLEYLLTHGPKSMGREFRTDACWVEELCQFNLTDHQGIDRGPVVRKKADRVLELINNPDFRNEECFRARKISVEIQGFGSNPHRVHPQDGAIITEPQYITKDQEGLSLSSDVLKEQSRDANAQPLQLEPNEVLYANCYSMSLERTQDGSSPPVSESNLPATAFVKSSAKSYRRTFSSPGYFRERPAQDGINELEEVNVGLLNAVKENDCLSCEDVQEGMVSQVNNKEHESLSRAPEESHSLLEGIETSSLVYNCKLASSFPVFPQTAMPKLRMKYQHQWQPARLTGCDVKFGKAA